MPVEIDLSVEGVRLVGQSSLTRRHPGGFSAETRAIQLLEITTAPVIGEPLFRALRYADELRMFLWRAGG